MARLELHDAVLDELDIEGVLDFAEVVATDAARLWIEGSLDQRQRLQAILFPRSVTYTPGRGIGTAETSLFFTWLSAIPTGKSGKASPSSASLNTVTSGSLNSAVAWVREMHRLRLAMAA